MNRSQMTKKRKDLVKFVLVMLAFMGGMIAMMIHQIHSWWIWAIYITIWTYVEGWVAKDFHLRWWVWVLIIGGLCVVDVVVITVIG